MTQPARRPWFYALVAGLLVLHYVLAVGSKLQESTTSDEIVHLTGGYTFNRFNDYRLHPENGNLPQRWAALPAVLAGTPFPALAGNDFWRGSEAWILGHQFFYESGADHFPRLMAGRAMIALFSVATGLLVFWWARRLFGDAGAVVALAFFAFEPSFLAHGALVTSDACMTFFLLASVGAWWRHLHDGRARWWWLSAVTFGLASVAKFSAPLLLPMFILLALVRALAPEPLHLLGRSWRGRGAKFGAAALSGLAHGLVAAAVIWAFFGFRYAAANPALPPMAQFIRPWEWIDLNIGGTGRFIRALAHWQVLPEAYLYGMAYVKESVQVRSAFLNGEFSITGWPTFFVYAFLYKTTLPALLAIAAAGLVILRRPRADWYRLAPLGVLFAVYWAFSLTSHLNIGHRHILPTYPVLFIAMGALGAGLATRRAVWVAPVVALVGWHVAESTLVAPHYLAYFNPLAGGPANGHRHLVDSSVDWGQDLPGLKGWLDTHAAPGEPVYLSYFGTGEPDYYHLRVRRLPFVNGFKLPQPWVPLQPGLYCVGATMLEQVYSPIRGPWTAALEREYQDLRALEPALLVYYGDPAQRAEMDRAASPEKWQRAARRHDLLRFARLCHYLRARPADANVGYSIFIYRLSAAEIAAATAGTLSQWQALIDHAGRPSQP